MTDDRKLLYESEPFVAAPEHVQVSRRRGHRDRAGRSWRGASRRPFRTADADART